MNEGFKAGYVNFFGMPNAGKSTLLNQLIGQKLAITSSKVQTTRQRILGIHTDEGAQIVFSDTPGIIDPKYKLHTKMMAQVSSALADADVGVVVHDVTEGVEKLHEISEVLKFRVPVILVLNKKDLLTAEQLQAAVNAYAQAFPKWRILPLSAQTGEDVPLLMSMVRELLPEGEPYFPDDEVSDRPTRFFVSELIREEIYQQYHEEIPYHTAVIIQSFEEKSTLTVIKAEIIVSRDTQKMILLGKGGSQIKKLGIASRQKIEQFLERKVHLELFIKVRPKWRDNENYLREYGYNR